jgi:hypothetical protein
LLALSAHLFLLFFNNILWALIALPPRVSTPLSKKSRCIAMASVLLVKKLLEVQGMSDEVVLM